MYKSIAIIVLALGLTQAALIPVGDLLKARQLKAIEAGLRSDASSIVDNVLANLRLEMINAGMDSVPLEGFTLPFSETILGVTYHGEATLKDGFLKGLDTIHRTGVADMTTEDSSGDFLITVDAGVNDGTLGYTGVVKFMNLGPTINAAGTLKSVSVLITIRARFNILTGKLDASLDKLDIKNLGTLNVDIKGLGIILNFVAELLVNVIGNLVKGVVGELLQGPIKDLLNEVIKNTLNPPTARFAFEVAAAGFQAARPVPYMH